LGDVLGTGELDVGARYRRSRLRLTALVRDVRDDEWARPVPACPGWRVHDVVAHLVGVIEDAAAGRIQGPPTPEQTAAEVSRHSNDAPAHLIELWTAMAPSFETAIAAGERWPAFLDVLSHEHDINGALGGTGPRDDDDVGQAARLLAAALPAALRLDLATGDPPSPTRTTDFQLRTTAYELFRLRLGRRTRDQVLALDWSADPTPILDDLFIFGPASAPFVD
jgi:uncharacterized protein (TIGR03083 family)